MPTWIATERLYLDREKTRVVREGDGAAASLLCGLGAMVPEDVCRKWGIGPYEGVNTFGVASSPGPTDDATGPDAPTDEQPTGEETEAPQTGSQGHPEGVTPETPAPVAETPEPVATDSPSPSRPRRMR